MRVLHIVPSFYPAFHFGGPIHALYGLCNALAAGGLELRVLTTDTAGGGRRLAIERFPLRMPAGYPVYFCRRVLGVSVSPQLLRHLPGLVRWAEVVHLTALYSFPTIPALLACRLLDRPVVWSPRGAFQRWPGTRRRALKAVWERACRGVAPERLVLHATAEEEARETLGRFPGVPVAVVPNGIDVPEDVGHVEGNGTLRLLYLGRVDPKKGIENLLAACRIVEDMGTVLWSLTLAGTGAPGYTDAIRDRIRQLGLARRVEMVGEAVGKAKRRLFERADLVVVPSHTENFAMVVAEALAHGVPVIASRGTPWRRLDEAGCGQWVENAPAELARAIEGMSRMPLREMGQRGREWMRREFRWDIRARQMAEWYGRAACSAPL